MYGIAARVVHRHRKFSVHLMRDQSILAPNFTVELVNHNRVVPVDVDLNFYRGVLEGR